MISFLHGTIDYLGPTFVIMNVGGVGYEVFVLPQTLADLKHAQAIRLWTSHVVREDAEFLYGFASREELLFFERLIQLPGIGPKVAMNIMSVAKIDEIKKAIAAGQIEFLTQVSGVGKKTAERVIVELREAPDIVGFAQGAGMAQNDTEVVEALVGLGYKRNEAWEAVKAIPAGVTNVSARVREALKRLSKK